MIMSKTVVKCLVAALMFVSGLLFSTQANAATETSSADHQAKTKYFLVTNQKPNPLLNSYETTNNFTVSPFASDPGGGGGSCSDWEYVYAYDGSRFGICTWHSGRTMIVDWSVETTWPMSYLTVTFSFSDGKKITVTRRPSGLFGQYGEEEHTFSSGGKKSVKMSGTVSGYDMDYGVFNTTAYETLP